MDLNIVGAGGHAKIVIEAARSAGWTPVAVYADSAPSSDVLGVPVLGPTARLEAQGAGAAPYIIAVGSNGARQAISRKLDAAGVPAAAAVVHCSAWVSPSAVLGPGVLVCGGAHVRWTGVEGVYASGC